MSGKDSPSSCYLLQANAWDSEKQMVREWSIVLDFGSGAMGKLLGTVDPALIDGVVISHCHADHLVDLIGMHVYRRWLPEGPLPIIPVLGPKDIVSRVRGVGGDDEEEDYSQEFNFVYHHPDRQWSLGPFTVESFEVLHPVTTYATRITIQEEGKPSRIMCYSGDTDVCENLVRAALNADLFLCESAFEAGRDQVRGVHMNGMHAGKVAQEANVKHLVITHLQPWTSKKKTLCDAKENYSGRIDIASPGMVFEK